MLLDKLTIFIKEKIHIKTTKYENSYLNNKSINR